MDLKEIEWSCCGWDPTILWQGPRMGSWVHDNKHLLRKN